MSKLEQADSTPSYDELYDKGFDEQEVDNTEEVEQEEEVVEEETLEQPEAEETEEAEELTDEQDDTEPTEEPEEDSNEDSFETITYKGQELKLTKDELKTLAQKGFDYTSKTQNLASHRQLIELAEENGLSPEDIKVLIDAKKGDKEALGYLAKQANVDPYDLDIDNAYVPQVEAKNYLLEDAVKAVQSDNEYGKVIDTWMGMLPSSALELMQKDPKILLDIHSETKTGIAQKVMPEVIKQMAMSPMADFRQSYLKARETVVNQKEVKKEVPREIKKKATITKKTTSKHIKEHEDVWENDAYFKKLQSKVRGY